MLTRVGQINARNIRGTHENNKSNNSNNKSTHIHTQSNCLIMMSDDRRTTQNYKKNVLVFSEHELFRTLISQRLFLSQYTPNKCRCVFSLSIFYYILMAYNKVIYSGLCNR